MNYLTYFILRVQEYYCWEHNKEWTNNKNHPEEEKDLENIMYELGYPLPMGYMSAYVNGG